MDCVGAISSISVHHYQHVVFLLSVLLSGLIIQPFVDDLREAYGKDRSEDDEDDDNSLNKETEKNPKKGSGQYYNQTDFGGNFYLYFLHSSSF